MDATEDRLKAVDEHLRALSRMRPSHGYAGTHSAKGARTVQTILKAAEEVFTEVGHAGLSLRQVASRSGVTVGNLNYYFPSKRALLDAMLRESLADYVDAHIAPVLAEDITPMEAFLRVVEFYVTNGRERHRLFFQIWGFAASDDDAKDLVAELYRAVGRFMRRLIKAANPNLSDDEARRAVVSIFSIEEGMKLFIGLGPEGDQSLHYAEEEIRRLAQRIVSGDIARA
ncbi:MAG: TetR family transcriptional regulator [Alphaproteobacteria bacterium]|nr:TetR family transcriptional regulator [Alphaproteobacteria bacterium]